MNISHRVKEPGLAGRWRVWLERRRGRQLLAGLDRHALYDLGLSRLDALHESRKPFWRA